MKKCSKPKPPAPRPSSVICPVCKALVGKGCRDDRGNTLRPHPERREKAELAALVTSKLTPEQKTGLAELEESRRGHEIWVALALCLGFNEIAKQAKTLGEKVYARLARDKYTADLILLGGNGGKSPFAEEDSVLEIEMPVPMPWVKFRESDIELMRQAVVEYDAKEQP